MQFLPNEQQAMIQRGVRKFAESTLKTGATQRDAAGTTPRLVLKQLAELGVFGLTVPEESGGLGLDSVAVALALEELAAADAGLALFVLQHLSLSIGHMQAVNLGPEQLGWLSAMASGQALCVWAHGEDALHRDADTVGLRATRDGDGWRLNGVKPNVFGAGLAEVAIVTAQTDEGLCAFGLQFATEGVTVAQSTEPLGLRSIGVADIAFANVRVTAGALFGAAGQADKAVAVALRQARLGIAAISVGVAREALRLAGRYANERQQFGKPIATFQPIQWQVANSAVEIDVARLLLHRAAWAVDHTKNADGLVAMARLTAAETATRVTDRAIQLHGGYGYTREFTVERLYRDAWTLESLFGSPGLQRVLLAKSLAA